MDARTLRQNVMHPAINEPADQTADSELRGKTLAEVLRDRDFRRDAFRMLLPGIAYLVFVALVVVTVFWAIVTVVRIFGDEPSDTYQCLVDTYLTDHLDINPDTAGRYSINSGDGLWLHVNGEPIRKIDETLFAEGIGSC